MYLRVIGIVLLTSLIISCKKEKEEVAPSLSVSKGVSFQIKFNIDDSLLKANEFNYTNAAGNNYSISRLQFYLSKFLFEKDDGTILEFDNVIYVDAFNGMNTTFNLDGLPYGNYKKLMFKIGLDSIHNQSGTLENNLENNNMLWPSSMGGGYHFLKLEGNYYAGSTTYGYAMHLGKNPNQVPINLVQDFVVNSSDHELQLDMNINEWFIQPYLYDFVVDGSYSMSDSMSMVKLAANATDVFILN